MGRPEELLHYAKGFAERLRGIIEEGGRVAILHHFDADGITAAGIIAKVAMRKGISFMARSSMELDEELLRRLKEMKYDLHIFCELGGGMGETIREHLGEAWLLVDHHESSEEELKDPNVMNCWSLGVDGSKELSGAGMAYFLAKAIDEANTDLSWLAIVGALADRQDQGPGHSLEGINEAILSEAIDLGLVEQMEDLMLYGRETRPLHEAIAMTTSIYLQGLTGDKQACLSALLNSGIRLKEDGRWRTLSELGEEEKRRLVELLIPHLATDGSASSALEELIGRVYLLVREDEHTPLRDAREMGTFLNACGRLGKGGVALGICLGDRRSALDEGLWLHNEYRRRISSTLQALLVGDRIRRVEGLTLVEGDGLVDERLLGPLASLLVGMKGLEDRPLLLKTRSEDGSVRFSLRLPPTLEPYGRGLGSLVRSLLKELGGSGGGHARAAGGRVPEASFLGFLKGLAGELKKIES